MMANFDRVYPNQLIAECNHEQAMALVRFDHHRVVVNGRWGVMLTYDWPAVEESEGSFVLRVVFVYAD